MLTDFEKNKSAIKKTQNTHVYLHRKNKTTLYLPYPPHVLLRYKKENPDKTEIPDQSELIYIGCKSK